VAEVAGVSVSTFDFWLAGGVLGEKYQERQGRGYRRDFGIMEMLAVAAGVKWAKEGASPERVQSLIGFVAKQTPESIEREFAAGNTFCVPPIMLVSVVPIVGTGTFIRPETTGPTARLFRELDLARCWQEVQRKAVKLPEIRRPGRRKRATK
jgi:hypothetical protein